MHAMRRFVSHVTFLILQVLKKFTSGGGGGGSKTELISLAMAEATKLFDKSGGAASGTVADSQSQLI